MKKVKYDRDTDILMIELTDKEIDYAEEDGSFITHFSKNDEPVLLEIQDGKEFILKVFTSMIKEQEAVIS